MQNVVKRGGQTVFLPPRQAKRNLVLSNVLQALRVGEMGPGDVLCILQARGGFGLFIELTYPDGTSENMPIPGEAGYIELVFADIVLSMQVATFQASSSRGWFWKKTAVPRVYPDSCGLTPENVGP